MLPDPILALPAAVLCGVAPGYFWARLLCPDADRTERITWSIALSLALVPVVALVLARLLGGGVTLPITIASPLIVLGSGLAAYLRFGPAAKGSDEPLSSPPAPMAAPALALVAVAFALVLWADLADFRAFWLVNACRGWATTYCALGNPAQRFMLPIALLLLAAGAAYLISSRGEARTPEHETTSGGSEGRGWVRRLLLPAVLLLVLARGYAGPVMHDWPHIRGLDHYSHAVMAGLMLDVGRIEPYLIYPPGFHTMTATVSRLSGLDPMEIFPVLGPALLLLPALSCYVLARGLWGWACGVAAALFAGAMAGGSYYFFNDAMYPHFVASQFLLVLAVAALLRLYAAPDPRTGLLLALLGSSVVLYHQVASLYLALLLGVVGIWFLPYLLLYDRRKGLVLLLSLALMGVLGVAYAWDTYDVPQLVAGLMGGGSATGNAVGSALGTQSPYVPKSLVGAILSQPVAWFGLLGAALLLAAPGKSVPDGLARATLIGWTAILLLGSLSSLSGFPQRFGRDLGVPLSLLAALAFVTLLRSLPEQRRPIAAFAASAAVLLAGSLLGLRATQSMAQATGPSPHQLTTPGLAEAGRWLEEHNRGGNIMVSPEGNQVSSRMMLAMGRYPALQSFTPEQLRVAKDLPPTGPGPLRDVLWVMEHPAGERTRGLLEEHDVRYLALYKNMPGQPPGSYWQAFAARPDLYEKVLENEDILVVRPLRSHQNRSG